MQKLPPELDNLLKRGTWQQIETQGEDVATLRDDFGAIAHISIDDGCWLLIVNDQPSAWWFPEAMEVVANLHDSTFNDYSTEG